jgi:hypothetical protein
MQSLKIIVVCVLAAIGYGIVHDQITARICVEYFTIFHPPIFGGTQSPTLLAFGWGVIATWWVGVTLGIPLSVIARAGKWPQLTAVDLLPMIRNLLLFMAVAALCAGITGYFHGIMPRYIAGSLPPEIHRRFVADLWAHIASYASGFIGGIVVWIGAFRKRLSDNPRPS